MTKQNISASPPPFLDAYAKQMWRVIVPYLQAQGGVKDVDENLIQMYCTQYGIYRKAYASIKKSGIQTEVFKIVQNSAGKVIGKQSLGFKRNPATSVYNDSLKQLISIGAQLGLSPKSRAELAELAGPKDDTDVVSDIKKAFGGGKS